MEPRRLVAILRRRAPVLVVFVLIGLLVGYAISDRTTVYRAQALLYVGQPITSATTAADAYAPQLLANVLAPAVSSVEVARTALGDAHIAESPYALLGAVSAGVIPGTTLIIVAVADQNPVRAEVLTNAMAQAFTKLAPSLPPVLAAAGVVPSSSTTTMPTTTTTTTKPTTTTTRAPQGSPRTSTKSTTPPSTTSPSTVSPPTTAPPTTARATTPATHPELVAVYKTALLPTVPLPTSATRYTVLGGLIALAAGLALVALIDLTGLAARSSSQLEAELDLPVLGVVPHDRDLEDHPLRDRG